MVYNVRSGEEGLFRERYRCVSEEFLEIDTGEMIIPDSNMENLDLYTIMNETDLSYFKNMSGFHPTADLTTTPDQRKLKFKAHGMSFHQ